MKLAASLDSIYVRVFALLAFLLVGLALSWPEPKARILVPSDGWEVSGGFVQVDAPIRDLRDSAAKSPETRYWRSWSPGHGSQPGTLRSKPFVANGTIAVPYNGFAGDPGMYTYLECTSDGRREYLATSRNNTQWSEVFIAPSAFCKGPVRIVAESSSTQNYVAIGTPYEVSDLSVFKQSTLASFWFLLLAWIVVGGCFLACSEFAQRRFSAVDPLIAGLIGLGVVGYALFFVYWFFPGLGRAVSWLLVLTGFYWMVRTKRGTSLPRSFDVRAALGLWLLVATAYLALALLGDNGAGPWSMNGRFTPARWSTDNQIPGFVARLLVSGRHDDLGDFGPWTIADRPPLVYGWSAALHGVLRSVLGGGNESKTLFHLYQLTTGIIVNSSWALLLAALLPRIGLSRFKSLLMVLVLSLSAFFIFNDLFVWPKLLSATFTLAAAWILLGIDSGNKPLSQDNSGLVAAAILSALGLLTHGGSAFGIAAAILLAAFYRGLPSVKGAAIAVAAALALLLPWSLWQANVQPPGNALLKFAFGGTFGFDEKQMGVMETVLRSYKDVSIDAWLAKKWGGLQTILFGIGNTCGAQEQGTAFSFIDRWRGSDFFNVMPSLNVLLLGFVALLTGRGRQTPGAVLRAENRLIVFALVSIALSLATTWDCYINHHQSYQALVALHLGLALSLLNAGTWGKVALALSMLYGAAVWVLEPLNHLPRFDYVAIALLIGCASAWLYLLRTARKTEPELAT